MNARPTLSRRIINRLGLHRDSYLIVIAAVIGAVTACGAMGFMWALHEVGTWTRSIMRVNLVLIALIPACGALVTGLLVHFIAGEARGHGVTEVLYALNREGGKIRPRVALTKMVASVCTIGSGGSAGAEGPIVQIGSALGSNLGALMRIPRDHIPTLVGCGAAAGIASVFNAPIAGVFFVLEILLRDFSVRTFTPIVVASVFSTAMTQAVYGKNDAIFPVSAELLEYHFSFAELPAYFVLGLGCAVVAVAFTKCLHWFDDRFERLGLHPIVKPVSGALILGGLGVVWLLVFGHRYTALGAPVFYGNGFNTIKDLLTPLTYVGDGPPDSRVPPAIVFLGVVTIAKMVATSLTLGSGGSGGVFAPSLFLGASIGGCFGVALERMGFMPPGGSPAAYALVGMAAVVAGTTHAPLTAMLLLLELTRDVYVLLPIMLAAVVATLGAQVLMHDSIYTVRLRTRGILLGTTADLSVLRRLTAASVKAVETVHVRLDEPLSKLRDLRGHEHITDFIVVDAQDRYVGLVTGRDLRTALQQADAIPYLLIEEVVRRDLPTIRPSDSLDVVMRMFSSHEINSLALVEEGPGGPRVKGLITRIRLMERFQRELEKR